MSTEMGLCPGCRTEQLVKKDGTLGKHLAGDAVCEGWNLQPLQPEDPAEPGTRASVEGGIGGDDWDDDADADPGDDDQADTGTGDAVDPGSTDPGPPALQATDEDDGTYRWQMTVKSPAIYLADPEWHQENALMAAAVAEQAGHTVTGEAKWAGDSGGGAEEGTVLLTYLVPVGS